MMQMLSILRMAVVGREPISRTVWERCQMLIDGRVKSEESDA